MRNHKSLLSALAIAAIGAGITACNPASVTSSGGSSGSSASTSTGTTTTAVTTAPGRYILQAMPAGTVTLSRGANGELQVAVDVFGLTPGSVHSVSIVPGHGQTVEFTPLTADASGQADTTVTSLSHVGHLPRDSRLVIRLGDSDDALAAEPIAETGLLSGMNVYSLHAITVGASGVSYGRPAGLASLVYNASAQTLTITVTAAGLTPGPHAAHIHLGSCQDQGNVKYMLADFIADAHGLILHQTRVVTGVTSVPGPGSWYLNLHMGGMSQILANGSPTAYFRPMLCTNITSFAVTGSASPSASASASSSASPSASASAMPSASASASASPSASSSPSPSPSASITTPAPSPTHW